MRNKELSLFSGKVFLLLGLFALAGCQASLPSQRLPELTYAHLPSLDLSVETLEIAVDYRPPLVAPNADHLFPVSPTTAVRQWTNDRLKAAGGDRRARLVISDASVVETALALKKGLKGALTKEQSERYEARIEATLEILDSTGARLGFARTDVMRSITVREDANINDRELAWFKLIETMMKDFDREMEKNIRRHLANWIK